MKIKRYKVMRRVPFVDASCLTVAVLWRIRTLFFFERETSNDNYATVTLGVGACGRGFTFMPSSADYGARGA